MNWLAVSGIAEIFGAIAVIVTLAYLAVQIRQNSSIVRTSNYWQLTAQLSEFTNQLISDPQLLEVYLRGIKSYSSLPDADQARFHMLFANLFTKYQVMFQLHLRNQIDQSLYDEQISSNKLLLEYPGVREWWDTESRWFVPLFQSFVNQSIADAAG